ncbi:MAG: DUF4124 domain-containing protein [Gammaproteobacteria bacterium]|nr:hypothetical protein [Gammaproteobacteria bacterium]
MKHVHRFLVLAAAACATSSAAAQKLYRWVDENGVVHYGDRIPPQYVDRHREVLNESGVAIGYEEGALSPEEKARLERERAAAAAAEAAKAEIARRDRMLLETYLSVEDIVALRDNRLEMLEAKITVTEHYIGELEDRLARLEKSAQRYKPFSDREDAPELPPDLAAEIESTKSSIESYREMIRQTREEQARLKEQFDSDIERFKELKGG